MFLGDAARVKVRGLTFAVPLKSRKTHQVIEAVSLGVQPHPGSSHTNPPCPYGQSQGILQQRIQEVAGRQGFVLHHVGGR